MAESHHEQHSVTQAGVLRCCLDSFMRMMIEENRAIEKWHCLFCGEKFVRSKESTKDHIKWVPEWQVNDG